MAVSINRWWAALAALALVLGTLGRTSGEIVIDYNTTIDSGIDDNVHVVEGSNPNPPTVVDVEASIDGTLSAFDSSIVNLRLGFADYVDAYDSSTVNLFDGWSWSECLWAGGSSTVNMSGGHIEMLFPRDSSTVNISGGNLEHLTSSNSSTANVSGGYIDWLYPRDSSTVNISAGSTAGSFDTEDSSTVNVFGGEIQGDLVAHHSSTIHIFGYDLQLTGGLLTGTLADGSPLDNQAVALENGRFVLHIIPEPSSLAILASMAAVGVGANVSRRRHGRRR